MSEWNDQSDNPLIVAQHILSLLVQDNGETISTPPENIMYGDQQLIPRTPFICVETGPMRSELAGAPFVLQNDITIYVMVYHINLKNPEGEQLTREECDQMAYDVRTLLHNNKQMDGLVIHGHVTNMDPGYATRRNKLLKMTRLTWSGLSKVLV